MNSAIIEIKDIAAEVETIEQRTHTDELRAEEVNTRLSTLYNLQKKTPRKQHCRAFTITGPAI